MCFGTVGGLAALATLPDSTTPFVALTGRSAHVVDHGIMWFLFIVALSRTAEECPIHYCSNMACSSAKTYT